MRFRSGFSLLMAMIILLISVSSIHAFEKNEQKEQNKMTTAANQVRSNLTDYSGHWAEKVMDKWVNQQLLSGYAANLYMPDRFVTRAEFVTFINRIFQYVALSDHSFFDVRDNVWYADAINKSFAAGIIKGVSADKFAPEAYISREDAAVIISRAFRIDAAEPGKAAGFADEEHISTYALEAVAALATNQYVNGRDHNRFVPRANITRAETVQLIDNVIGTMLNKEETFEQDVQGNLVINSKTAKLQHSVISGDLYIAPGVGEGEIILDDVTVKGKMYVLGGGVHSIIIRNSQIGEELIVDKWNSQIRIVVSGTTDIAKTLMLSGGILEEDKLAEGSGGFVKVVLEIPDHMLDKKVTLSGRFQEIINRTKGVPLHISKDTIIQLIHFLASANVDGEGIIEVANIDVDDVILSKWPLRVTFKEGVSATIELESVSTDKRSDAAPLVFTQSNPVQPFPLEVWMPANTEKIRRDQAFPSGTLPQQMMMEAAQNEYEGAQLVLKTTGSTPVQTTVAVSDLTTTDGAVIGHDNIQMFQQHYVKVETLSSGAFPKGFYPDALIPITATDLVDIEVGNNQGLWFTVHVPKGQMPGVYTGMISLKSNNQVKEIPVQLTVWDFELSDEGHTQTAFDIWYDQVAKYHGVEVNTPEYWELIENYYWFQTEYRLPPDRLPIPTDDVDQFMTLAEPYLDDPRVNSFNIPFYIDEPEKTKELVDKLRVKGWLSKGYFYLGNIIDEPSSKMYPLVREYAQLLKQIAPDVKHILTKKPVPELYGDIDHWAVPINAYDRSIHLQREANDEHLWWYTMVYPTYPFPSYDVDDVLISARLLSWMQMKNKVEGNLYWSTTVFEKLIDTGYVARDVWNDPLAFPGANGDGFLLYPGKDFGLNKPIPSLRLEAIRDGMEDFEYLWMLEERMKLAAVKLGLSDYDIDAAMDHYYDRLFQKLNDFNEDANVFAQVRREIAKQIMSLNEDPVILYTITETGETTRELTIYTEAGATLKADDTLLQPVQQNVKHDVYQFEIDALQPLNEVELAVNTGTISNTFTVVLPGVAGDPVRNDYVIPLNDPETQLDLERWTTSRLTATLSDEYVATGNHSMKLDFRANVDFPNFRMWEEGKGFQSKDWSKFKSIRFYVYNPSDETSIFYMKFHDELGNDKDGYSINIAGKTGEYVEVPLYLGKLDSTQMKGFEIWLYDSPIQRTLYFDDFHFLADEPLPAQHFPLQGTVETLLKDNDITISKAGEASFTLFMMNTGTVNKEVQIEQLDTSPLQLVPIQPFVLQNNKHKTIEGKFNIPSTIEDGKYTILLQISADNEPVQTVKVHVRVKRNIINNGDFENGIAGWHINGDGGLWDTQESYTGTGSMQLFIKPPYYPYVRIDQFLLLEPGEPYKFSAWMKGKKAGKVQINFSSHDIFWNVIPDGETKNEVEIGEDWTYVELPYMRDPNKDYEFDFIFFWISAEEEGGTNRLWVDDISLMLDKGLSGDISAAPNTNQIAIKQSGQYDFGLTVSNEGMEDAQITIEQIDQSPLQLLPMDGLTLQPNQTATLPGKIDVLPTVEDGTYTVTLQVKSNGIAVKNIQIKVKLDRNIIKNSGFETGVEGWHINGNGGAQDSTVSHTDAASMRMDILPDYSPFARTDQFLLLEPGQTYQFSAWMKAETAGKMYVNFVAHDEAWEVIPNGETKNEVEIGEDWTHVELTYTRDPNKEYEFDFIYFWIRDSSNGGTDRLWVDDVTFSLVETGS